MSKNSACLAVSTGGSGQELHSEEPCHNSTAQHHQLIPLLARACCRGKGAAITAEALGVPLYIQTPTCQKSEDHRPSNTLHTRLDNRAKEKREMLNVKSRGIQDIQILSFGRCRYIFLCSSIFTN